MPANVEIKARAHNFAEVRRRAEALSNMPLVVIQQEDTFFNAKRGRLKLRILAPNRGEIIYYERPDQDGPKRSEYYISETSDAENLKYVLERAYGIRGIVKKTRYLYMIGQTRVHLDEVQGLGQFMELEVVMGNGQSDAEGQAIAEDLMQKLGIQKEDLVKGAYIDLIENYDPRPRKNIGTM